VADDDRPQYQHGVGTIGGTQFHWGSGTPGQYWSIPYGDYPVTPNAPTGAWAHQAGAIPIANNVIPDPLLGRNRIGIMIHSGSAPSLDQLYTEGCFKVDPQDWPNVRSQILAEADKGPLYLHVAPGGVAAFTNTKTFSQAGENTPAATANATANTTAATQPSGAAASAPYTFNLPANAPMGMGNNNPLNIKYYKGAENTYAGLIGPSSNTDQGDPQMKFATPEAGWNAAYSLLNKKYSSGMTTPNAIIAGQGGWTPGNTEAAANVAKAAGIGPNDDIGFSDPAKAQKFMRALVTQEQGGAGSAYPDAMIAGAISGKPAPTTAVASAAPVAAPGTTLNSAPAVGAIGTSSGPALPGFGQQQSNQFLQGASGLEKAMGGQGLQSQQGDGGQDQIKPSPMMQGPPAHQVVGPGNFYGSPPAQAAAQTFGQTLNSMGTPLQWGSGTPGSPISATAGPQVAAGVPQGQTAQELQQIQMLQQQQRMMQMMGGGMGTSLASSPYGGGYG
jgi:hypothetical protein